MSVYSCQQNMWTTSFYWNYFTDIKTMKHPIKNMNSFYNGNPKMYCDGTKIYLPVLSTQRKQKKNTNWKL